MSTKKNGATAKTQRYSGPRLAGDAGKRPAGKKPTPAGKKSAQGKRDAAVAGTTSTVPTLSPRHDPLEIATRDSRMVKFTQESHPMLRNVMGLLITTPEGEASASKLLVQVKGRLDDIEGVRKFFVDPLKSQVKRMSDFFKRASDPYEKADEILRQKLVAFRNAVATKQQEEQRKLAEASQVALAKGDDVKSAALATQAALVSTQTETTTRTDEGKVTFMKVWEFEVVDEKAVPREYLSVDLKKVRSAVRSGLRNIPGVHIHQVERPAVSADAAGGDGDMGSDPTSLAEISAHDAIGEG